MNMQFYKNLKRAQCIEVWFSIASLVIGQCRITNAYSLGKIVGGGMPLAVFGGSSKIMSEVAPSGPIYQGKSNRV